MQKEYVWHHEFDSDDALNSTFKSFKELADKKHEIFDEDLQAWFGI
jgi:2-isopropylmalate synthase